MLLMLRRKPEGREMLRTAFYITGALILLVPTLYPWYLVGIVPFLCFFPSPAWVFFTGTAVFYYLGGVSNFSYWVAILEYIPVLALFSLLRFERIFRRGC
jgi:hypothetical protein